MSIAYSPSIVMSGLVLCLDAANQKSYNVGIASTAWNNLIGSGNNATLVGGIGYEDKNGGILRLDGVNDYAIATRPESIVTGGPISVCIWAKWNTFGTTIGTIQALVDNAHGGGGFGFVIQDRPDLSKTIQFSSYPTTNGAVSTFQVGDGRWHYIVGTNDQTTTNLYIDGVLNSSVSQQGLAPVQSNITFGSWQSGPSRYLNGNIAQASIYNRALTAAEVLQNYNALKPRFPTTDDLLLYLDAGNTSSYPGSGTVWTDLSGNDNNATLVNGVGYSNEFGGALTFDGVNDYALVNLEPYTPYCIDIWFYNNDDITSAAMPSTAQQLLGSGTYPGGITLGAWTNSATDETFGIFSNTWPAGGMSYIKDNAPAGNHNLVINWNGSNYDFWLDGTKRTTYASTFGHCILQTKTVLEIGRDSGGASSYEFNGKVYSLKINTSSLTDGQIQENYNISKPRFASLIPIVTNGLVLNLDAGNTNSYAGIGTIWTDLSGNGNNGTLGVGTTSAPTYSSSNGGSLVFDGPTDVVTVTNTIPSLSNLTIELFVKTSTLDNTQDIIFDQFNSLRFEILNNKHRIHLGNGSGWLFTDHVGFTTLSPNTWYQSVWTWNGSSSILYLNGTQDSLRTYASGSSGTGVITIGQYTTANSDYNWNGNISSVKVYNRALSAAEIQQNFNSLRGRFGL